MEMRTNRETEWHDGPTKIVVPEGEIVWRELLHNVPSSESRWMKQSIDQKKRFFKLNFVPIRIRGWWAIIDATWLESLKTSESPTAPVKLPTKRKTRQLATAR